MKFPILIFVAGLILVSGCKKKNPTDATSQPTAMPAPTSTPIPVKRVFVTSTTHLPQGSIANMETICQNRAITANLGGSWKIWMSDSSQDAKDRLLDVGPWYLINNTTKIADNITDLSDGTIDNFLNMTELGGTVASGSVWTGTYIDGTRWTATCNDWTSTSSVVNGAIGATDKTGTLWMYSNGPCNVQRRLYCFEQ